METEHETMRPSRRGMHEREMAGRRMMMAGNHMHTNGWRSLMFRMGSWIQRWAERGAHPIYRAGERAQEWAESGQSSAMRMGSRMQDLASPGMRWDPRAEMMGGEYRPMWRERMSWPGREAYGDERMEMMEGRPYGRGYYGMSGYRTGFSRERPYGMSRQTRGPKNYRRSDERIREDVCDLLCEGHFDARDIEVSVENGEVTLSGSVRSKEAKRMAEDMADDTGGVMQVHNQLRIHEESTSERGNGHPESERRMHQ